MAEVRKTSLRKSLMNSEYSATSFGLQLEGVQIHLRAGHKLEPHRADENKIRSSPFAPLRPTGGSIFDDACA